MDFSHLLAGGLTAVAIAILVWMELHSRRNGAAKKDTAAVTSASAADAEKHCTSER